MIKQVSVFLENKEGRLVSALKVLGDNLINIRAMSIAENSDFGILRLIVNKPDETVQLLKNEDFRVMETEVLAAEVNDSPGGLAKVLGHLAGEGINIEYMYAFLAKKSDKAIVIFRVEDEERAVEILNKFGVNVLNGQTLYEL